MYKSFFGLQRNPFEISPDPHFLYPTPWHYEAMANLYHAIQARKGLVVITGEVGTGKTLLVRCLLEKLAKNRVQFAYVFNPLLGPLEFLRYVSMDLGLPSSHGDKSDLLHQLNSFLIQRYEQGHSTVLIVDEAHLLSREVLEESRLLSNLETPKGKLLQIAFVGQPELDEKLDASGMRQLKQRIALRCSLRPLRWDDAKDYIQWRLKRAGAANDPPIFSEEALHTVYEHSRGLPRLINTICENSLISGFAAGTRTIPAYLVDEACADLRVGADASLSSEEDSLDAEMEAANQRELNAATNSSSSDGSLGSSPSKPSIEGKGI